MTSVDPAWSLWASLERETATIGVVDAVSPNRIDVAILPDAPHGTGLRDGALLRFPRLNSYVVLPTERGNLLALVYWLGIDDDRNRAAAEPDHIGLPVPRRQLRALPLGVLHRRASAGESFELRLERGVLLFPTVGDPVRLPTRAEAAAAVPQVDPGRLSIMLGRAPLAGDVEVSVDPNRLLGRHLAVLGNTGSGKSCTVTTVVRRCAEAAGESTQGFRAIVLDLNGEYSTAFNDLDSEVAVRRFSVEPAADGDEEQLRVPTWLWSFREWLSFSRASARSQAPQLRQALDLLRSTDVRGLPPGVVALIQARHIVRRYEVGAVNDQDNKAHLSQLDAVLDTCADLVDSLDSGAADHVRSAHDALGEVLQTRRGASGSTYRWEFSPPPLNHSECQALLEAFQAAIDAIGVPSLRDGPGTTTSVAPTPFDPSVLIDLLPLLAADSGPETVGWVMPLIDRLRIAFAGHRFRALADWHPDDDLAKWLGDLLPEGDANQIAIVDLSLVPSDTLQLVVAVLVRTVMEALERRRRLEPYSQVPVVLVVEEAHALINKRVASRDDETVPMDRLCREAFDRVAREGRKFGLSLVVSSQRPSELSETVLSQCNTFLVHRIVNDHDQALVRRLVPDTLGPLTDELPALPSQVGLLLGWAVHVPILVRVDDLALAHQPHSADPDFAAAWAGGAASLDWSAVAARWGGPAVPDEPDTGLDFVESAGPDADDDDVPF